MNGEDGKPAGGMDIGQVREEAERAVESLAMLGIPAVVDGIHKCGKMAVIRASAAPPRRADHITVTLRVQDEGDGKLPSRDCPAMPSGR